MNGWTKKMLRVDLSDGSILIEEIEEELLQKYLGGRGLGAYFVYTEVPPDTDPLGPDNILAFCNGAMTGVNVPTGVYPPGGGSGASSGGSSVEIKPRAFGSPNTVVGPPATRIWVCGFACICECSTAAGVHPLSPCLGMR